LATELRWILAGLSALLLAGIWWWGARRSRQAPGNAALRESTMGAPAAPARTSEPVEDESDQPEPRAYAASRDWGVPPFEPLSIRTANFDQVEIMEVPMTAHAEALKESFDLGVFEHEVEASELAKMQVEEAISVASWPAVNAVPEAHVLPATSIASQARVAPAASVGRASVVPAASVGRAAGVAPASAAAPAPAASGESAPAGAPQGPNASETQRIVTIRVCAQGESRWAGVDLMAALENHGLAYGRYQVFHRKHSDGRTLFCAASLIEPGTFNIARMPQEEYRGLTLFAVLPGPVAPLQTLDALIMTAGELAETLDGMVQDSKGMPLSQQGAEALREDVAHFQASLAMH
jgi:FtsZ-interacting cell division protein ZipA